MNFSKSVLDFEIGMFIQSSKLYIDNSNSKPFVGTVVGITVNPFGEPVLMVHITTKCFGDSGLMESLGYEKLGHSENFYEITTVMHPNNLEPLDRNTVL